MAKDRTITLRLPENLLLAAARAARVEEMTAGDFIRAAVADRVAEFAGGRRDAVGALRRALRRDFSAAADWLDLQRRLRAQKLVLRAWEGEVWLMTWPVERRLVPLCRLGVTAADLTLLYRAPFPAHGGEAPKPKPKAVAKPIPFPVRRAA